MTLSTFTRQRDPILSVEGVLYSNIVASNFADFALATTAAAQLSALAASYQSAYDDLLNAESEYKKAIQAKETARQQFTDRYTALLSQSYATPSVTNATLASVNLNPKSDGPNPIPLQIPTDFLVDAFSNGYAKFRWKRAGNSSATVYTIEAQIEDGAWEVFWSGTKSRVELPGVTPGVPVKFRVYASKGGEVSPPSNEASVYGGGGQLQLAA